MHNYDDKTGLAASMKSKSYSKDPPIYGEPPFLVNQGKQLFETANEMQDNKQDYDSQQSTYLLD